MKLRARETIGGYRGSRTLKKERGSRLHPHPEPDHAAECFAAYMVGRKGEGAKAAREGLAETNGLIEHHTEARQNETEHEQS
jgi:hypothetical protein